jgi:IS5 family transposase
MQFFEHELPIHPSSMMRWRKRLVEAGAEAMLKATLRPEDEGEHARAD